MEMSAEWAEARVYTYRGAAHVYEVVRSTHRTRIRAWPLAYREQLRERVVLLDAAPDGPRPRLLDAEDEMRAGALVLRLEDTHSASEVTVTHSERDQRVSPVALRAVAGALQRDVMSLLAWMRWRDGRPPLTGVMFYGTCWPRGREESVLYADLAARKLHRGREWHSRANIAALVEEWQR